MTTAFPLYASVREGDPWWKGAVVYQIYPRSFADADGDGIGDLRGIIGKLDYLKQLGVDVLWLSPICTSPQDDNGYDISDYQDIDPLFGTLAEYDELLAESHARGIRVVMDLVLNHSSDEHAWFEESRSSKDNPKRDWYIWKPGRNGGPPNNWTSWFSGSAWELDDTTGEYYLHIFSKKQPDLNWENPDLRRAIYDMINWWLDRGVDGFRMDVINLISKVPAYPDGDAPAGTSLADGSPFFMNGPRIHEFLREFNDAVFADRDVKITVGEMPGVTIDEARRYTDPANREVDMVFQFEHMAVDRVDWKYNLKPLDFISLKRILAEWQTGLQDVGWNSLYWNNHDQPRAVSRFGDDGEYRVESAKMLAAVLHGMKGTPYIYQGEEIGMTNFPWSRLDEFLDIEAINAIADARAQVGFDESALLNGISRQGRDNARTPMQWTSAADAGFTTGQPWLPVNPNTNTINAEAAVADPDSVFHFYRRLIELRHELPVLVDGDFTMLLPDHPALFLYTRSLDDTRLLVMGNFTSDEQDLSFSGMDSWDGAELLLGNVSEVPNSVTDVLRPWETRVYIQDMTARGRVDGPGVA